MLGWSSNSVPSWYGGRGWWKLRLVRYNKLSYTFCQTRIQFMSFLDHIWIYVIEVTDSGPLDGITMGAVGKTNQVIRFRRDFSLNSWPPKRGGGLKIGFSHVTRFPVEALDTEVQWSYLVDKHVNMLGEGGAMPWFHRERAQKLFVLEPSATCPRGVFFWMVWFGFFTIQLYCEYNTFLSLSVILESIKSVGGHQKPSYL